MKSERVQKLLFIWVQGRIFHEYLLKFRCGREEGVLVVAKVLELCSSGCRTSSLRTILGLLVVEERQLLYIVMKLFLIVLLMLLILYELKLSSYF